MSVLSRKRLTRKPENEKYRLADCTVSIRQVVDKLAEYEDLEEQGLLLRLPTKDAFESSGDMVYYIYDYEIVECINCGLSIDCEGVAWIALACDEDIFPYRTPDAEHDLDPTDWCQNTTEVRLEEWGKTVFLTQSEAEEKLRELEEK